MYSFLKAMATLQTNLHSDNFFQVFLGFSTFFLSFTLWNRRRKWKRTVELIDMIPGPKKYMLLENIPQFLPLAINPGGKVLDFLVKLKEKHGSIFRYWLLGRPTIVVADAEVAIRLYKEGSLQGKSYWVCKTAKAVGGEGLLALPPQIHHTRRKQWLPSFSRKQVEISMKFFQKQAIRLCDELEDYAMTGQVFDLLNPSVGCTFRAICYSAFGEKYMTNLPETVGRDHMHDLHTISLNMTSRMFRPWTQNEFFYFYMTAEGRETMKSIKRGNLLAKNAIRERKAYLAALNTENRPTSNQDFGCFLDHMLQLMSAGKLTEEEIIQELNVFIVAGYDTTGITICFVLYFLSLYPEHQERVLEELREAIPPENWNSIKRYPISDLITKQTPYLELCIKETLRLYPVLPISPRSSTHDVILSDGRIIPRGVDVVVPIYMIHRDPKYFPLPNAFLPERHLKQTPAFIPFTLGSRNCIGQVYAMHEMKIILAYLLMAYKWETTEKEGLKMIFQTLQVPQNGIHFKISRRTF